MESGVFSRRIFFIADKSSSLTMFSLTKGSSPEVISSPSHIITAGRHPWHGAARSSSAYPPGRHSWHGTARSAARSSSARPPPVRLSAYLFSMNESPRISGSVIIMNRSVRTTVRAQNLGAVLYFSA